MVDLGYDRRAEATGAFIGPAAECASLLSAAGAMREPSVRLLSVRTLVAAAAREPLGVLDSIERDIAHLAGGGPLPPELVAARLVLVAALLERSARQPALMGEAREKLLALLARSTRDDDNLAMVMHALLVAIEERPVAPWSAEAHAVVSGVLAVAALTFEMSPEQAVDLVMQLDAVGLCTTSPALDALADAERGPG